MRSSIVKDLVFTLAILLCILAIKIPYLNMALAAIVVIIYAGTNEEKFKSVGFQRPVSWLASFIQSLFLATVIILLVLFIIKPAVEYVTQSSIDHSIFAPLNGNLRLLFIYVLIGWVIGGLSEEFIFRGFFLKKLTTYLPGKLGVIIAILSTSVFFGFLHSYQGIAGQIQTGTIGAILASIYFISGRRLIICILTHGLIDTIYFTMLYLGVV